MPTPEPQNLPEEQARPILAAANWILRRGHAEGLAAHGMVALAPDAFARGAVRLVGRRSSDPVSPERIDEVVLRSGLAGDVFLALACDEGIDSAWHRLEESFLPRLLALARSRGLSPAEAEEVARDTLADLSVPPSDGSARTLIGTYRAAGSLGAWLSVILLRRLVDRARSCKPHLRLSDPESDDRATGEVAALSAPGPDPSAVAIDTEALERIGRAVQDAWSRMPTREALAVRLRYRDELPLKTIAAVLRIGESRTSRVIQKGVETLKALLGRSLPPEAARGSRMEGSTWRALQAATGVSLANPTSPPDSAVEGQGKASHAPSA